MVGSLGAFLEVGSHAFLQLFAGKVLKTASVSVPSLSLTLAKAKTPKWTAAGSFLPNLLSL